MTRANTDVPLGVSGKRVPPGTHMCMIYESEEERRQVLAQFLAAGIENGERVMCLVDGRPEDSVEWLREAGVPACEEVVDGLVQVLSAHDVYCSEGAFDPDIVVGTLCSLGEDSARCGYKGVRIAGQTGWAAQGLPGSERLLEYEARLEDVLPRHGVTGLCQYDTNMWDGRTIYEVLKVHPYTVVRGRVLENPYFVSPKIWVSPHDSGS